MNIKLMPRRVYGNLLIYPACETSRNFARLTGNRTFNARQIETIESLGYQITYIPEDHGVNYE